MIARLIRFWPDPARRSNYPQFTVENCGKKPAQIAAGHSLHRTPIFIAELMRWINPRPGGR